MCCREKIYIFLHHNEHSVWAVWFFCLFFLLMQIIGKKTERSPDLLCCCYWGSLLPSAHPHVAGGLQPSWTTVWQIYGLNTHVWTQHFCSWSCWCEECEACFHPLLWREKNGTQTCESWGKHVYHTAPAKELFITWCMGKMV